MPGLLFRGRIVGVEEGDDIHVVVGVARREREGFLFPVKGEMHAVGRGGVAGIGHGIGAAAGAVAAVIIVWNGDDMK